MIQRFSKNKNCNVFNAYSLIAIIIILSLFISLNVFGLRFNLLFMIIIYNT